MRKSVLFLIPTLENGGAEKVLVNLVNNMDFSRYNITVQTIFDYGVHKRRLNSKISYRFFLKRPFRGYSILISILPPRFLYRLIIRERYEIVISYLEGSAARIVSGCPYKETKRIGWIHTVMDNSSRLRIGFICREQALKTYESFDRLVFVSEAALQAFQKTGGVSWKSCRVIYNTNETKKIRELSKEPIDDVTMTQPELKICSVGKITPNKGFDRLAHILKRLRDEQIPVHIYAVGIGEQQEEIEKYLSENHIEEGFTFIGYRENPYKYMATSDLYVCASHREGFSTAVTEALIVGTPVISTNCSGAEELLGKNNRYGIVVDNSEKGLYEGIKALACNTDLLKYYKKQAQMRGDTFSTHKTVNAVEKMIEEVLHG